MKGTFKTVFDSVLEKKTLSLKSGYNGNCNRSRGIKSITNSLSPLNDGKGLKQVKTIQGREERERTLHLLLSQVH